MGVRQRNYVSKKTGKSPWVCEYFDAAGKRRAPTFPTKKAADAYWAKVQGELAQGTHVPDSQSVTLDAAYESFMSMLASEGAARSTIENHKSYYKVHIKAKLGSRKLVKFLPFDVQGLLDDLRDEGKSADTLRRCKITLGAIIDEAVRTGRAIVNPVRSLRPRRQARRTEIAKIGESPSVAVIPERHEVRALIDGASHERSWLVTVEGRRVVSAMSIPLAGRLKRVRQARTEAEGDVTNEIYTPPNWLQPMLCVIALAGLRPGEARGLTWQHVNLDAGVIDVRLAADRYDVIGPVKTVAGLRQVPIGSILRAVLTWWRERCPKSEAGLVFPSETDKPISVPNLIRRHFAPLQQCTGIVDGEGHPRYTPHTLRHFAVSLWIDEGASIKQVSQWVGHESTSFTQDVYGHLFQQGAIDRRHIEAGEVSVLADAAILQQIGFSPEENGGK